MEAIRDKMYTIAGIGFVGIVGWQVFTCYRKTGSVTPSALMSCFMVDTGKTLIKSTAELGKYVWDKGVKKGAVDLYKKALKPIGMKTFNKVLKPGFKQLKHTPKLLEKASQKAVHAINPFEKNRIKKGLNKGAHSIKKGLKKVFKL